MRGIKAIAGVGLLCAQGATAQTVVYDNLIDDTYINYGDWVGNLFGTWVVLAEGFEPSASGNLHEITAAIRDLKGRGHRYLHLGPSKNALARARETIRWHTGPDRSFMPVHDLVSRLNLFLNGWANYFGLGHPRRAFRHINRFVRQRLLRHLRRRSQRPYRPPTGVSWSAHLDRLGLVYL